MDVTQDLTVTWQINGTVPIIGWRFIIMKNDADSTVLYNGDWQHEYYPISDPNMPPPIKPVYGRDEDGNYVNISKTISAADLATAGVVNGYEKGYKLKVNQQYYKPGVVGYAELEEISPVFFSAVDRVQFLTDNWLSTYGRYAWFWRRPGDSQGQMLSDEDMPVIWNRWRLAKQGNPDLNVIEDTGTLYLTNAEQHVYGLLKNNYNYAVRLTGEVENGYQLDTGWHNFHTSWTDTHEDYIHLKAYYVTDQPCVYVQFEADEGHDLTDVVSPAAGRGWTIVRVRTDNGEETIAGIIPRGQIGMYDFGARNNTEYIYRAYYGLGADNGNMYETERPIKMRFYWDWAIIECEKKKARYQYISQHYYSNYMYHVVRVHTFQGNVDSGSVSNENQPYVENNFTPYPTVQKVGRKGLKGKLRAWVGRVKNCKFHDSISMIDRIMDMSTNDTVKFLRDRKGNIRMIEIADAIVKETQDKYAEQPVAIEIPWVEVGDASECQIVSTLTDGVMAGPDGIINTSTAISTDDNGYVIWSWDNDGYVGSEIDMTENGELEQEFDVSMGYAPADLTINSGGNLEATTVAEDGDGNE